MNVIGGNTGSLVMGWDGLRTAVWRRLGETIGDLIGKSTSGKCLHEHSAFDMDVVPTKLWSNHKSTQINTLYTLRLYKDVESRFVAGHCIHHSLNSPQHDFVFSWKWFCPTLSLEMLTPNLTPTMSAGRKGDGGTAGAQGGDRGHQPGRPRLWPKRLHRWRILRGGGLVTLIWLVGGADDKHSLWNHF